ncbi:MAG: PhzF family phenazine biosynthesis protein [Bacteroidetes bacterium]|nr:PhzF family phenazine biosynthesis protein [Bacteroidota bacterium]
MKVYVVNAFTKEKFGGNPAAVVPLEKWLSKELMQNIAAQHNLAETAFIIPRGNEFEIRWFTPTVEVDLCGHATLASAHVYFNHLNYKNDKMVFYSRSGSLHVSKLDGGKIMLDFPANAPTETTSVQAIEKGLQVKPLEVYTSTFDYMVLLENQQAIEDLNPDFKTLAQVPSRGVIATAKGNESDFVSRCFFPQSGIDEDPVTGSAHTVTVPYWAKKLGKSKLSAIQLSERKGYLDCEMAGDRVLMSGYAVTYLVGDILI